MTSLTQTGATVSIGIDPVLILPGRGNTRQYLIKIQVLALRPPPTDGIWSRDSNVGVTNDHATLELLLTKKRPLGDE